MVFSSIPAYLDPLNWNQQIAHQSPSSPGNNHPPQLQPLMSEPPPQPSVLIPGLARPVSMAERARLAKIPQPEPALKCPRCDSTNTKFCYFNNYSLSQPRHFCKTCRRYWTRGGSLRNVPVGGGCRRNKRSKASNSSKSSSSAAVGASSSSTSTSTISPTILTPSHQVLPFMTPFDQPLSDYSATNIGLGFAGIHPNIDSVDYQVGSSGGSLGLEQWRLQQIHPFPFLGGIETTPVAPPPAVPGLFAFDGERCGGQGFSGGQLLSKVSTSGLISQLASVKMEDSHGLNFQRQYLGVPGNDQYWGGNSGSGSVGNGGDNSGRWIGDMSGFSSSSGNIL